MLDWRAPVFAAMAIVVFVAFGFVWGYHHRGTAFEADRVELEAKVRQADAEAAARFREELAQARVAASRDEQLALTADEAKTVAINSMAISGMTPAPVFIAPSDLEIINQTIERVAQ